MSFRPEIKEICLTESAFSKSITEVVQGDIIVPDTKGDIGKILQTDAQAVINSKEISGGRVTVSGTVYATVIYSPAEGGIDAMTTSMDFSHTSKTESDDMHLSAVCSVKSVEHSLYNTRKMNVKANLGIKLTGTRDINPAILAGCECSGSVEECKATVISTPVHIRSSDVIPFRETLDIPAGAPGASSVLKCTASFIDKDFRLLSNKAVIKGNLVISVLYKGEDGSASKAEFIQPFTEITDAPGAEEDMKESISAYPSPFTATPAANGDGNMRAFFIEGKIMVETECMREEQTEVITDMFCTDFPLKLQTASIPSGASTSVVLTSAIREPVSVGNVKEIIDLTVRPVSESCEVSGDTITINGKAEADLLCKNEDGGYFGIKKIIPYTLNGTCDGLSPSVRAEVSNISAVASGGDAEVRFTVTAIAESSISSVNCVASAFEEQTDSMPERPSLVIYATKPGDTLWSIAKKYSVTTENIKTANNITDTIPSNTRIIIPR